MTITRVVRAFLALFAAGALAAVPMTTVLACSCMMTTILQSLEFSAVAFIGTVSAVEAPPARDVVNTLDPTHYAFAVEQVFKGEITDAEAVLSTAMDGSSCGTSFAIDERWIVFANVDGGELWTSSCSGNVLLAGGEDEQGLIDQLGEPIAEPEATSGPAQPEPFEIPAPVILVAGVAVLVVGVSAWAFVIEPRRRVS